MKFHKWLTSFYKITFLATPIVIFDQLEFFTDYFNQSCNPKRIIMAEKPFFEVEELLCKQDVEKLKLFAATLGIVVEQIKTSKGRRDLKYIIIKVL